MIDRTFLLNERHLINPELNSIMDSHTGFDTRVEPRLMLVLTILVEQNGELVTREQLIQKVWNEYGGGEDGLNQAISLLRKILKDNNRDIIETIPKKGYVLHAKISVPQEITTSTKHKYHKKGIGIAIALLLAVVFGTFVLIIQTRLGKKDVSKSSSEVTIGNTQEVAFSELKNGQQENFLNTITTTGPDKTKYRIVAIGDYPPKFYINDKLQSEKDKEGKEELIQQMLSVLWQRKKTHEDSSKSLVTD